MISYSSHQSLIVVYISSDSIYMSKRNLFIWALLTLVATTNSIGQVRGGFNTYALNCGLSIAVGTQTSVGGRSFVMHDPVSYRMIAVKPESYQPRWVNPIFGINWWSETSGDDFVFGYQVMANYGTEKYNVTLGLEPLQGSFKSVGLNLGCYVGWHIGSRLTACVGLLEESRFPIRDGGILNIFNSQNSVGLMALVRYVFAEDYFVSLHANYGLFSLGGVRHDWDWEAYSSIGSQGYYVTDTDTRTFSLMVGIGRGF